MDQGSFKGIYKRFHAEGYCEGIVWVEWGFGAHSRKATTSNLRKICANKHAVIKLYWEWGALQGLGLSLFGVVSTC